MDIETLLTAVGTIQESIVTPAGEEALQGVTKESPAELKGLYPIFYNREAELDIEREFMGSPRTVRSLIHMHLLFAQVGGSYSRESRRRWVKAVLDRFDQDLSLDGNVTIGTIDKVLFNPISVGIGENEKTYVAATFVLRADAFEDVNYQL